MDPFSAITGIAPLCVTSAGLLVSFYQYINDVGEVPRYVEELTSELCSLNTGLAQLKRLVLNRKKSNKDFLEQWAKDSKMILDNCCETLEQINRMIQKAKIETKSSSKGQVMRCMKWLWNKNEVILMRDRLERYKSTISMMLQSLSSEQQDNASALMDKIHKSVLELQQNRQQVKETLVVMDKDHPRFQEADFTITYNPIQIEQTSTVPNSSQHFRPLKHQLLDRLALKTWKPRCIRCTSDWEDIPQLLNSDLKIVLRDNKIACLEISIRDDVKTGLDSAYSNYSSQKRELSKAKVPEPFYFNPPMRRPVVSEPSNVLSGALQDGWDNLSWWQKVALATPLNVALGTTAVAAARTLDTVVSAASAFDRASAESLYLRDLAETTEYNSEVRMAHERRIQQAVTESWDPGPFPTYLRTFRKGKVYFEISFSELTRKNQYGIYISPGKYTYANRRKQGSLEIEFDMSSDVDEFLQLLRSVKIEVESSWKTHALSFSNVDAGLKIATPEEVLTSAAEQEYKWGTYLRACLD